MTIPHTFISSTLLFVLMACGRGPIEPPNLQWRFEARPAAGHIAVLPVLSLMRVGDVSTQDYVGPIPPWRLELRKQRIHEIQRVPEAVGLALPGALASNLPKDWNGQFRVGTYPKVLKAKLTDHLSKNEPLDSLLSELGLREDGVLTLVSWVEDATISPITTEAAPGEMVESEVGPIAVNLFEESYRIRATVGLALIASDGQVILRYRDDFESILGAQRNPMRVGRDLALGLAQEIVKMWPSDPRLKEHAS